MRRRYQLLGAAALAAVLAVPTTPAWSPAEAADPEAPAPTLTGAAPAGSTVTGVTVLATPTDTAMRTARNGTKFALTELTPAAVTTTDNAFTVALDPANVPAANMDRLGLTHLTVLVATDRGSLLSTASVRAVAPADGGAARFAEPATSAPTAATAWARTAQRSFPVASAATDTGPVVVSRLTPISQAEAVALSGPTAPAGCSYTKLKERVRPATIGTTYPVAGDKAKMIVTSSTGARYGTAVSVKDSAGNWADFRRGSEKYAQSSWGKAWDHTTRTRSYRKGVEYGLFRLNCSRGCWNCSKQWFPTGETGGNSSRLDIPRPNWGNCTRQDPGRWWRDDASGKAYTYDNSVKFAGVIGVDLSISRQYNSSQKLLYRFYAKRRLCGSNDWPSTAGKVMERRRR